MIIFKGRHTPQSIIIQCVRWYCAYPLSYRNIKEIMAERGIKIDHSTLNRWVIQDAPKLEKAFHKKKKRPADHGRMLDANKAIRPASILSVLARIPWALANSLTFTGGTIMMGRTFSVLASITARS